VLRSVPSTPTQKKENCHPIRLRKDLRIQDVQLAVPCRKLSSIEQTVAAFLELGRGHCHPLGSRRPKASCSCRWCPTTANQEQSTRSIDWASSGTCCRSKGVKTSSPQRSSTARSRSTTCSAWLSSPACCSLNSSRPTLSPPHRAPIKQSHPFPRRSRHASVRKSYPLDQPRDRQGSVVRLVRARKSPRPPGPQPGASFLHEHAQLREDRRRPKEQSRVVPSTGTGEERCWASVFCAPIQKI
jgi:hypothetical protein